ncbi:MAG: RNA polymerase factor sigma-54 [Bacillaceae bacterium]
MELGLFQKQTLKTVMTTELRQGIALLQYNTQELTSFLYEKSLENPLIELKERTKSGKKGKAFSFEQYREQKQSLSEHLINQLWELNISKEEEKILQFLIYNLTKEGYLRESIDELVLLTNRQKIEIENAISLLQTLEPAGVGARDVKECLLLQIKRQKTMSELAVTVIEQHFEFFLRKNYRKLSQLLKVEEGEIRKACEGILSLDPRPGMHFNIDSSIYIVPDLLLTKEEGIYYVSVVGSEQPKIQLCHQYTQWNEEAEKEEKKYLNEKYYEYQWIIKSLNYRHQMLVAVANVIIEEQRAFLERGPLFLKPLTLKELANRLHVHESTISRTVRNKYMQTPFGIFELKYFFSTTVSSDTESVSNKSVQLLIKKLISEEDKSRPLSDQQLMTILGDMFGIKVARRTVTKYREACLIPSSKQRKKG